MPANVTIEFEKARIKYEQANSPQAKLAALLEMQSAAPKHKGGENLRAEISKKIALLKREMEKQREKERKRRSAFSIAVKREGIAQVCLVGMPNSGKSTLLKAFTGADVEISAYPFTTKMPEIAMLDYKGAKIQVVEVPALVEGSAEGKANGPQMLSIIRNADAIVLVVRNAQEEILLREELRRASIILGERKPAVEIKRSEFKGISVSNKKFLKIPFEQLENFLKGIGMHNANVLLEAPLADLKQVEQALDTSIKYKRSLTINPFKEQKLDLEKISDAIFEMLGKILVYTKKPGSRPEMSNPLALPKGSTVSDAAARLPQFSKKFRYARVWGSTRFPGQRVSKGYELQNLDIIEFS